MLTNACYDELRRRQRHARLRPFSIDAYSSETDPGDKLVSQDITAEDSLEQVELSDTIRRCLDIMPRSQRDPLVLVDILDINMHAAA